MIRVRPAHPDDLPGLTRVLVDAFSVKMRLLFGRDPARTQRLLTSIYSGPLARGYDGILVAELDQQIVGGLVIEPMPWGYEDVNRLEVAIRTELGTWRRWWNGIGFSIFTHGPEEGDAYLSDVGVLHSVRGQGIGKALVRNAEAWAIFHERQAMTLWVASNNPVARHIYERAGMAVVRHEFNLLSGLLYGIPRWTYMRKPLS